MKQAFIVATGPSLLTENYDFDYISRFKLFGLNRAYLLDKLIFDYLIVVNDLVIKQFWKEIVDYCNNNGTVLYAPRFLFPVVPYKFVDIRFREDKPHFETEYGKPMWQGHTVTYVAIQIAFQLGFDKVGIIGLDHYYKRAENKPTNKEEYVSGPDPDHFIESYFNNVRWHTPNLEKSEIAYTIARAYYEFHRRILVNCTISSRLSTCALKKVHYRLLEEIDYERYKRI